MSFDQPNDTRSVRLPEVDTHSLQLIFFLGTLVLHDVEVDVSLNVWVTRHLAFN